jgi:hypothetical protein
MSDGSGMPRNWPGDEHEQRDGLRGDEEPHEGHLLVLHGESVGDAALAGAESGEDQRQHEHGGKQPAELRRQVVGGEQRVEIALASWSHGHGGVVDDEPEQSFEDQKSAQGDDESRHALAHDERAHRHPDQHAAEQPQAERRRRWQVMMKHEHTGDAAEQAHAAAGGQIDVSGQKNEQHAHRQRGGDGKLRGEHRQIARTEKGGLFDRKEHTNREQGDGDGQFSEAEVHGGNKMEELRVEELGMANGLKLAAAAVLGPFSVFHSFILHSSISVL